MDTKFCYGQIAALTREKYHEAHDLILRAWTEDEPFAFDGRYTQLRYGNCWPGPIQKPHPPIDAERWKELLPHATVATVARAGHMLRREGVDEVAAAWREHLR